MTPVIVGKNQTFYIGSRRFDEGDIIPASLSSGIEIISKKEIITAPAQITELKQEEVKRTYHSRQKKDLFTEENQE